MPGLSLGSHTAFICLVILSPWYPIIQNPNVVERYFLCGTRETEQIENRNMQKKGAEPLNVVISGQRGNAKCLLRLQQLLQELRHVLKAEKADTRSSETSILVHALFQSQLPCSALTTEVSPERALRSPNYISRLGEQHTPSLGSHKAPNSVHSTPTMDSHAGQAIGFHYVNHFILFSNTCREQRATAGQIGCEDLG